MIWRLLTSPFSKLGNFLQARISIGQLFLLLFRFSLVMFLSLVTPLVIRRLFVTNFVELQQPLEFTFRTCATELAGVCSFPEAEFTLEEEVMQFHPGYYYSFVLDLILFDTTQNRALSLMIANLQLRDEQQKLLANFHKSVPIFKAFSARSIIFSIYTFTRNMIFWPLWLIGFFSSGSDLSDQFSVHFPNFYLEKVGRPTKHVLVQLQNKFIQLSSATLRVRTHVGICSYFLSEYPLSSYLVLACASFVLYFSCFAIFQCVQIFNKIKHD